MAHGKTKAIVAIGFAAALIGGGAAGLLASRYVHRVGSVVVPVPASLSTELQLTKDQQSQIRQIWEQVQKTNQQSYEDGQSLDQWRTDQIVKLLNPQQFQQFQKINSDYQDRYTAMTAKRQMAFDEAVAKTRKLLNSDQRKRYDQILEQRMGTGGATEPQPGSTHPAPTFSASAVSKGVVSPG